MSTHYLVRCTGCKAIIEQCRCPGPKVEREGRCNTCDTPDEVAALRAEVESLRSALQVTVAVRAETRERTRKAEARADKAERELDEANSLVVVARGQRDAAEARAEKLKDAGEMLWVVVANVSGGNWKLQSQEWQDAAAKWRDNYFAIAARALAGEEGE